MNKDLGKKVGELKKLYNKIQKKFYELQTIQQHIFGRSPPLSRTPSHETK